MIEKAVFYEQTKAIRAFAQKKQPCGTHGHQGGIDGEVTAHCFFPILQSIQNAKLKLRDPLAYGWDVGKLFFSFNL
jgi:hypothetical protein